MTESFTFASLPWDRVLDAQQEAYRGDGQRSYSKWIVYLSSDSVITVIMVWKLWARRSSTHVSDVDEVACSVNESR
jgi:hypothetical protein